LLIAGPCMRPFTIFVLVLLIGCKRDDWDSYAQSLTTTKPNQKEIVGSYLLTQQTINTNGMAILQNRQCQLDLQPDGSFEITNYPIWTNGQFASFISTIGHWHCDTVGFVYSNQRVWGVRFSDADSRLDALSFTGKTAPYGLLMTYGDPDENAVMIFEKKK
jgi:hypothetical protein